MRFCNCCTCILIQISLISSSGSIQITLSIGLGNGLVPNTFQAITWTNDDTDHWHNLASLGYNELIILCEQQEGVAHVDLYQTITGDALAPVVTSSAAGTILTS